MVILIKLAHEFHKPKLRLYFLIIYKTCHFSFQYMTGFSNWHWTWKKCVNRLPKCLATYNFLHRSSPSHQSNMVTDLLWENSTWECNSTCYSSLLSIYSLCSFYNKQCITKQTEDVFFLHLFQFKAKRGQYSFAFVYSKYLYYISYC